MHPDLEALVLAWDAVVNRPDDARRQTIYDARLEEAAAAAGLRAAELDRAVRLQHVRWLRAQQRPSTLPPRS